MGRGGWGVKGDRVERKQDGTALFLESSRRVAFDSLCTLEHNPPGFQFDEHAFGGDRGAFLWAEGSAAYEDEYLSFASGCCVPWMLRWRLCKRRNKVVLSCGWAVEFRWELELGSPKRTRGNSVMSINRGIPGGSSD